MLKEKQRGYLEERAGNMIIDMHKFQQRYELLDDKQQRKNFLIKEYPGLYVEALRQSGRKKEMQDFMKVCKSHRYDRGEKFTLYIVGYLVPWFEQERLAGKLTFGK